MCGYSELDSLYIFEFVITVDSEDATVMAHSWMPGLGSIGYRQDTNGDSVDRRSEPCFDTHVRNVVGFL